MIKRRAFLFFSFLVLVVLATSALADQALTWSRIGKGGLGGSFNPLQEGLGASCLFKGKLYYGTEEGQVWCYDGRVWSLVHKPQGSTSHSRGVEALAVLGDYLYAGMEIDDGPSEVWRTSGTGKPPYQWTKVSGPADIGSSSDCEVNSMAAVKSLLYVGTGSYWGCRVWAFNGSAWSQVVGQGSAGSPTGPGFGTKDNYAAISMASSATGELFVGTSNSKGGAEIWRLNKSGWAKLNKPGFGTAENFRIPALAFFNNGLYAGTHNYEKGCQVWKYLGPNGSNWKAVGLNGLGDPENEAVLSAVVFGNPAYLHVITMNHETGCLALRTNGKTWEKASLPGFGEGSACPTGENLIVFDGKLFAGVASRFGAKVYSTSGGAKPPFAWTLRNESGFTRNDNRDIWSAASYGGKLYIGTENGLGCEVWRYEGNGWTQAAAGGFGDPANDRASSMAVANGYLYVGTENGETGAEIWRYDGSKWTQANKDGFGDDSNRAAEAMVVHAGKLYVGTESYDTKAKVWRCDGLGASQWTKVNNNGFGLAKTAAVRSFAVFNNKLYAGTFEDDGPCRVWRFDGPGPGAWTAVSEPGFGDQYNNYVPGLAVYKGALYAGVNGYSTPGVGVWRYSGSGTGWSKVSDGAFGTGEGPLVECLAVFSGQLFVSVSWEEGGGQLYSYDGSAWSKASKSGFGTANNRAMTTLLSDASALYAGTWNYTTGCEIWTTGAGSTSPFVWRASPFFPPRKALRKAPGPEKKKLEIGRHSR